MGSHLLPMDHDHRDANRPTTRCATGIMPVAVSPLNAPPTATPSSVMSRETFTLAGGTGDGQPGFVVVSSNEVPVSWWRFVIINPWAGPHR